MMRIKVDDRVLFYGNFWDWNTEYDLPNILDAVGVKCEIYEDLPSIG